MDFLQGGELYNELVEKQRLKEEKVRFYALQIAIALSYLHDQKNLIYRSIKPENICIGEDGYIALVDFDFCKITTGLNDRTYTFCGTPEYLAPEQIRHDPYNRMVDWWGLGVIVYELIVGNTPFFTN